MVVEQDLRRVPQRLQRDHRCHVARTPVHGASPGTIRQPERATLPKTMSSGRTGTRLSVRPVAARMAATIAGVLEIVGGSPTPFAPYGASGCGCSTMSHTTGGMSRIVGSR